MKVLVFAEQRGCKLKTAALEALTIGAKLAGSPSDLSAVIVGSGSQALASELAGYGADKVYTVDDPGLANYNVQSYAAAVEAAIKASGAKVIIGTATPMGRDLFPRLAARLDAGMLSDLVELKAEGDSLKGVKPMYAGKCLAHVATQNSEFHFALIRQNVFAVEKSGQGQASAEALSVSIEAGPSKTVEIRKGQSEKADLTEASVIISGGRAMGNADNFKILHECAEVIGATVGASRAAVDSGYASHDMQVGQTGKTVNPNLYIACGISGSVQHMAGMRTSKVIVAVNTDPEAPIFAIADYGIVGDLFEAVPKLSQKFKELLT